MRRSRRFLAGPSISGSAAHFRIPAEFGLPDDQPWTDVVQFVTELERDGLVVVTEGIGDERFKPAFLTNFRREGSEVPCPAALTTRGARSRTLQYVERPEARKRRWVQCIADRSRKLVRNAG
jgi:hypothetical protein